MNERAMDALKEVSDCVENSLDGQRARRLLARVDCLLRLKWRRPPRWFRKGAVVEWSGGRPVTVAWAEIGQGLARGAREGEKFRVDWIPTFDDGEPQVFHLQSVEVPRLTFSPWKTEHDGYGRFPWRRVSKK